jgi:hypothetical protein
LCNKYVTLATEPQRTQRKINVKLHNQAAARIKYRSRAGTQSTVEMPSCKLQTLEIKRLQTRRENKNYRIKGAKDYV